MGAKEGNAERLERERFLNERVIPAIAHKLDMKLLQRIAERGCLLGSLIGRAVPHVRVEGLEQLVERKQARSSPGKHHKYVYIPSHKSELDYALIQTNLIKAGIPTVLAAGDNLLRLPYLGEFFRRCGAHGVVRSTTTIDVTVKIQGLTPRIEEFVLRDRDRVYLAERYAERILLEEDKDYLIFPEKMIHKGVVKHGRSYDGSLLPFDTRPFGSIARTMRKLNDTSQDYMTQDLEIVPVFVTYEHVPEDANFPRLQSMKGWPSTLKYAVDFLYLAGFVPLCQVPSRATVRFGTPIEALSDRSPETVREFATVVQRAVGTLVSPYETQLFATCAERGMKPEQVMSRMREEYTRWSDWKIDMSNITDADPAAMYKVAKRQFCSRCRNIVDERDGRLVIMRPDVISQYRNHVRHLLE